MKSVQEKCGLFGLYSSAECVYEIFQDIDFLQHRGQQYYGIAAFEDEIYPSWQSC